jgi:hypothetical protein
MQTAPSRSQRSPAAPCDRELRERCPAAPAIDSVQNTGPEPKRPTPFAYFQIHVQVVHFILQRHSSPPASLGGFQRSDGLARLLLSASRFPGILYMESSGERRALLCCCRATVSWDKRSRSPGRRGPDVEAFRGLSFHPVPSPRRLPCSFREFVGYKPRQTRCQAIFLQKNGI